jgi:hypothetical protein
MKGVRELQKIERAYGHDEPKRCELMYRGAMSEQASDALRFALGVDRACAQLRKFEVITGGAA